MVITLNRKTVRLNKDEVFEDPRAVAIRWLKNYNKVKAEEAAPAEGTKKAPLN